MKLTKIASMVMTSATVLSTVAAATPAIIQAQTQEGNAKMNGGKALPDTNHSKVGITFAKGSGSNPGGGNNPDNPGGGNNPGGGGDNPDNPGGGNNPGGDDHKHHDDDGIGYLRLQRVPEVLDFGTHTTFNSANPVFTAAGTNVNGIVDGTNNDVYPGYAGGANQTPKLSTTLSYLSAINGKTWVTVVDKQETRHDTDAKNDSHAGNWQLSVKANGPLTTGSSSSAKTISGATLGFNNTVLGETQNITGLTGNPDDGNYNYVAHLVDNLNKSFTVNLAANGTAVQVGSSSVAATGSGAAVFAWDPSDIKLTLPASASVDAGTYTTSLTWTLSTGIQ
ncbi:WxL domain-containing protein [Lactobacillus sp. ESL0228]|uniref:WxL domain-containing protein n=1 Tax=Lactobacillus sp. ESL0228 TaxID=2069352 RepID=UPI000EFAC9B0|nr:WxL domain-containing protein [Lactobacillus sp. ESL0228]RMC51787.1 cell surface protein [Lactobacillus sp. ESL0228]